MPTEALSKEAIREAIRNALGTANTGVQLEGAPIRGRYSIVQPVRLADGRKLAAKFCLDYRNGQLSPSAASSQYASLQAVNARMQGRFGAPLVHALHAPSGLVLMQWMENGVSLAARLREAATLEARLEVMRSAALWLRAFHQCKPLGMTNLHTHQQLAALSFGARERLPRFVREACEALHTQERRVAAVALPRSWVHGDFKLENLFVVGDRVIGLDIELAHESAVLHDIAPLLNRLRLTRYAPGLRKVRGHWLELEAAFLESYFQGASLGPGEQLALNWLRLAIAIYGWREHGGLRGAMYRFLYRPEIVRLSALVRRPFA